jgi:hypothetical protein
LPQNVPKNRFKTTFPCNEKSLCMWFFFSWKIYTKFLRNLFLMTFYICQLHCIISFPRFFKHC